MVKKICTGRRGEGAFMFECLRWNDAELTLFLCSAGRNGEQGVSGVRNDDAVRGDLSRPSSCV